MERLSDLCNVQLGKTPPRGQSAYWDKARETGNVWLSIADLVHGATVNDSKEYISDRGADGIRITPEGTLLLSFKLTIGRVSFAGRDLYTNEAIASLLDLSPKLDKRFLYYYFSGFDWDTLTEGDIKLKGKTLNKAKLNELPIPLPPLTEQQRIVTKLDAAFAALAEAQAQVERNRANARELFESYLNGVFEGKQFGWSSRPLNEVCTIKGRIGFRGYTRGDLVAPGEGAITLSPSNIKNQQLDFTASTYISWTKYHESPEIMLRHGDVVLCKTASVGKCAYVDSLPIETTLNPQFIVLKDWAMNSRLGYYYLRSPLFQKSLKAITGGTATPTVSQAGIGALTILVPPEQDQKRIVADLDGLGQTSRQLEATYAHKLTELEGLKKGLLGAAFRGEL